jgi:ABC-2 type transport system permease protein
MTTAPLTTATAGPATERGGLRATGLLRSEWIKLRSVRSTVWAYAVTIVAGIGFSAMLGLTFSSPGLPATEQVSYAVQAATLGLVVAQLSVAVLGVLVISGEYSTGMIRSTLTAIPQRYPALLAKAAVFAAVTFVVGLVITFGSYFVSAPLMAARGAESSLGDPGVVQALVGGALFLTLIGVLSLGIGTVVRSGAGGIAAAIGLIMLAPIVFALIPAEWAAEAARYLPTAAGAALYTIPTADGMGFEPWQGLAILLGWIVLALGSGTALLTRRDA